jgi:hypothetical protein
MTDKNAEKIAALERKVAELERAAKPPEPYKPDPDWRRYDPTANMRMPDSALRAMVNAVPDNFLRDIVRDNRAPQTPSMIPGSQQMGNVRPAGGGTGWVDSTPLGPSPHQRYVDQQIDAQEARDRQERIQQAAQAETARKFAERSEQLDRATEQTRKLVGSKP